MTTHVGTDRDDAAFTWRLEVTTDPFTRVSAYRLLVRGEVSGEWVVVCDDFRPVTAADLAELGAVVEPPC